MLDIGNTGAYIPHKMTPAEFRSALDDLGIETQREAAARLGVTEAAISRWINANRAIPGMLTVALEGIRRTAQVTRQTKRGRNGKANTRKK